MTPSIPELPEGCDTLKAAILYAEAGIYVLPIARFAKKNPGSVVGKRWQDQSSRDPQQIASWFAGTDHGIGLHLGRSGLIAVDVDYPDKLPDVLAEAIDTCKPPFQTTRRNGAPGRGHYPFAMPPGRMLGNSTGRLGGGWGELRGKNGIIVVAPSLHDDEADGGFYQWQRGGPIPVLPKPVADLLPDAEDATEAATDAQVEAFLDAYTWAERPELVAGWVTIFNKKVAAGDSRHERMVKVCAGAMKEARAGYINARQAADGLEAAFVAAVSQEPIPGSQQREARKGGMARGEWAGILAWAVAQAKAADMEEVKARVAKKMPSGGTVIDDDWLGDIPGNVDPTTGVIRDPDAPNFEHYGTWGLGDPPPAEKSEPGPEEQPKPQAGKSDDQPRSGKSEPSTQLPEEFWNARDDLRHIRQAAHSRGRSAEAVLGAVLCRVAADTQHWLKIPPLVGSRAGLSFIAALGGGSGDGKSSAKSIAMELYLPRLIEASCDDLPAGSGEGFLDTMLDEVTEEDADGNKTKVMRQHRHNVFFYIDEGEILAKQANRSGSNTILPNMRSMFSDTVLGTTNTKTGGRNRRIKAGQYCIGVLLGIQPEKAAPLFGDTGGGTPQRFCWFDAGTPAPAPGNRPEWPGPLPLGPLKPLRSAADGWAWIGIPDEVRAEITWNDHNRRGKNGDPLDKHRDLVRLKVAALLAVLDSRVAVHPLDWSLAGMVLDASDAARADLIAEMRKAEARENRARGKAEGVRRTAADEVVDEAIRKRVAARVVKKLTDVGDWLTGAFIRKNVLTGEERKYFAPVMSALHASGLISQRPTANQQGLEYRIGGDAS
jgi:hypothetical protein